MVFTIFVTAQVKVGEEANVAAKLKEAAAVYKKDPETLDWFVMQDPRDATKFAIVERYESASSLKIHTANPYYAEFGKYLSTKLEGVPVVTRYEEL